MTNKTSIDSNNVSRRKFLQGGAILGATIGLSSITGSKMTEEVVSAFGKKEIDEFPHEVSPDFKRFDNNKTTFIRMIKKEPTMSGKIAGLPGVGNVVDESKPGFTTIDNAFKNGANSVNMDFTMGSAFGNPNSPMYTWEKKPAEQKYEFASKEDATKVIKRAGKFYGADLIGITAYDERWVYDPMFSMMKGEVYDSEFPFKPKSVIVMAIEMDYENMGLAPTTLGSVAAGLGYSNMAEVTYKLSTFIRELGYNAFGAGNDVAESVPYAIAAGLGEQGRQGLLITYEYGPRVRLCKIFTDMELVYDKPIKFGANDFCKVCKKCAEYCPSQSISKEDNMTWKGSTDTVSNHTGVLKYYVDVESCFVYWNVIGNGCGVCITVCPYNKPDFWHHRITTAMTSTPLKPFLNEMDDLFGYGNIYDEQGCIDFWGIDNYTK